MKLDVGCGTRPHGTVNCDLSRRATIHRVACGVVVGNVDIKHVPNFVCCDSQHLPFRSNTFKMVYSANVIEHVDDPGLMLREMIRVSCGRVEIHAPHRFYTNKWNTRFTHKCYFTKTWFAQYLQALKVHGWEVSDEKSHGWPFVMFTLFSFPQSIKVEIWK